MAYEEVEAPEYEGGKFFKFKKIGDKFEGYYVSDTEGTYGTDYTFRLKDGAEVVITAGHKDLKARLLEAKSKGLKPGHMVLMMVANTKDTGKDNPMFIYRVAVDKSPKKPMPEPVEDKDDPFAEESENSNPF